MLNARLTMMNKAANDIAPTFDAAQAACNVACTIAGSATQIFRGPDALALHLRPAKYCFAISLDVALYSTQKLPNAPPTSPQTLRQWRRVRTRSLSDTIL